MRNPCRDRPKLKAMQKKPAPCRQHGGYETQDATDASRRQGNFCSGQLQRWGAGAVQECQPAPVALAGEEAALWVLGVPTLPIVNHQLIR